MSRVQKEKKGGLGQSIQHAIQKKKQPPKYVNNVKFVHQDLRDKETAQQKLISVIDESNVNSYINMIEMNQEKFSVERGIKIQNDREIVTQQTQHLIENPQLNNLRIPRRPKYIKGMSKEELHQLEAQSFYEWRKQLALMEQEHYQVTLTPYEKNLNVWKQLWIVIEKSDIIVQVLDGRDPMFFKCEDLQQYVKEVHQMKSNFLLINKSDLISLEIRELWSQYFLENNIDHMFFSAKIEQESLNNDLDTNILFQIDEQQQDNIPSHINTPKIANRFNFIQELKKLVKTQRKQKIQQLIEQKNSEVLQNNQQFLQNPNLVTIGMVGFPNVGKSSVINSLVNKKKVGVACQPGKTKNFQTLFLEDNLILCDCPGLIFPSAQSTRAQMVCNGVLPIDKLKDYISPVQLLCDSIPKQVFEQVYSIKLQGKEITASQLLQQYAIQKKFYTGNNLPDEARSSRIILKQFVKGDLLFCQVPQSFIQQRNIWQSNDIKNQDIKEEQFTEIELQAIEMERELDQMHFKQQKPGDIGNLEFTQEEIDKLINGQKIQEIKLNKYQRRELKYERERDYDGMLIMLERFLGGKKEEIGLKAHGNKRK